MSLLRALRVYVGLGPDDEIEGDYLDEHDAIDLTGSEPVEQSSASRTRNGGSTRVERSQPVRNGGSTVDEGEPLVGRRPAQRRSRPAQSRTEGIAKAPPSGSRTASYSGHGPDTDGVRVRDKPSTTKDAPEGAAVVHSLDSVRAKPKTVIPEAFADAKAIADDFKFGVPIVLNLQGVDRELARRLIDFASGLCYGLDGSMEKIAPQVFLVTPSGVEVADEDRDKIHERGYAR